MRSDDGTPIAVERAGSGPALVLVGGSLDDGAENAPLAAELAASFTVVNYARRGRGASGTWTGPYAVERELEDLAAVIGAAGDRAAVLHGVSSGGALALHAVRAGLPVDAASVYEVPFGTEPWWDDAWSSYRRELVALLDDGRDGDAIAALVPHVDRRVVTGQGHVADPAAGAPLLTAFAGG